MRSKLVLFACLILSLLAAGFFGYRWRQADSQLRETVRWTHFVMDSLTTSVTFPNPPYATGVRDTLYLRWVATIAQIQSRKWQQVVRHWVGLRSTLLDEVAIAQLKQDGLEDPPRQLRESLMTRADLIPLPGELGGTMEIEDESIVLLEPPYAFARFDDGHVGGSMLLQYSVLPGGRVDWQRLWASLE